MQRSWSRSWLFVLISLAVVSVTSGACIGKRRPDQAAKEERAQSGFVGIDDVDDELSHLVKGERLRVVIDEDDPQKGADAPLVTIVEYSDFQCPYCSRLAGTLEEVLANNPHDVKLVFKQFPLPMHADAEPGSRASLAAHEQGKFWPMHDKLFANQRAMSTDDIMGYAREIGLDMKQFETDFESSEIREHVREELNAGRVLEVSSTPTFFINGRLVKGAKPLAEIQQIVEEEKQLAQRLIAAGSKRPEIYARILRAAEAGKGELPEAAADPDHKRGEPSKIPNYAVPVGEDTPTRGPDDALVTILEFTSYDCEDCTKAAEVLDAIVKRHRDVRHAVRFLPKEDSTTARSAANVALAAAKQDKFWPVHEKLLAAKSINRGSVVQMANALGVDSDKLLADGRSPEVREQLADTKTMADKFRGTTEPPFLFVNGRFMSGVPEPAEIEKLIAEEKAKAQEFLKENRGAKDELYESMRETWRGYKIAEEAAGDVDEGERVEVSTEGLPVKGDPKKAKVSIVACSDFDCPFCSRVNPTMDKIAEEYGDDVAIYFRQFPLPMHQNAEPAHRAALAAHAQGKFWPMHDKLFADRNARSEDQLAALAREIGLDVEKWRKDFNAPATKAKLDADMAACRELGVTGTPSFFINGRSLKGAQPYEKFAEVIDAELKG